MLSREGAIQRGHVEDKFVITTLEQLRAVSEPLRLRVVEMLTHREMAVAELARALETPAGTLYHHVDVLLEAGLIQVTRRQKKRGTEERFLRAVARDITVDDDIFMFGAEPDRGVEALLDLSKAMLQGLANELEAAARSGAVDPRRPGRRAFVEQQDLRLTEAEFEALCRRLDRWITAAKTKRRGSGQRDYRFGVLFFPAKTAPSSKKRNRE